MLLMLTALPCAAAHIAVIAHRGEIRASREYAAGYPGCYRCGCGFRRTGRAHHFRRTPGADARWQSGPHYERRRAGARNDLRPDSRAGRRLQVQPAICGDKGPFLDEALALAHGKIGVYVDSKDIAPDRNWLAPGQDGYAGSGGDLRRRRFPEKSTGAEAGFEDHPEAYSAATLERLLADCTPRVVAFDAGDFKDDVIMLAKHAGAAIYVDRLGAADNPAAWQDAIDRGAAGIQTDRPAELVEYLRTH